MLNGLLEQIYDWLEVGSCVSLSTGLTWQDDTTQQAVSKELSKLRRVSYRRPVTGPADIGSGPRRVFTLGSHPAPFALSKRSSTILSMISS